MESEASFFDVPRHPVATSAGDVDLPILYYNVEALLAYFLVDIERAEDVLQQSGFWPVRVSGRALVGLAFYVHHDTSIGPYNEACTAIAAVPEGIRPPVLPLLDLLQRPAGRRVGFYIVDLPVSTPAANVAGRELWGYPKFVTDLPIEFSAYGMHCSVNAPETETPVVSLHGTLNTTWPLPSFDLLLYSQRGRNHLRTVVDTRGWMHTGWGSQLQLTLGPGDNAMANNLRQLGLDGERPLFAQHAVRMQLRLHGGEVD